jgi:hypothetical protein
VRHRQRIASRGRRAVKLEEAAHVERVAGAAAGGAQPVAHRLSAFDQRLDLRQLARGEVTQLGVVADRGRVDSGLPGNFADRQDYLGGRAALTPLGTIDEMRAVWV